jgi:Acetyltransferase (GNAT) family
VARCVRYKHDPSVAELAVAAVDDWQGQGIRSRLTAALADRARAEGIRSFSALVVADNQRALNLLDDLGPTRVVHSELGKVELIVALPEPGPDAFHACCAPSREKTSKRLLTAIDRKADQSGDAWLCAPCAGTAGGRSRKGSIRRPPCSVQKTVGAGAGPEAPAAVEPARG